MNMNTQNTENKLFVTLFATFLFLMLASFGSTEARTETIKPEMQQVTQVKAISTNEVNPKIATVYIVGKRLPKAS